MGQNKTRCSSRLNTWSFVLLNLYKWSSEYNSWAIKTDSICRWHKQIITNPSPSKFKEDINNIIDNINDWSRGNALSWNFYRNHFLQFRPENSYEINIKISCDNKLIKETKNTKFTGLDIGSSLSWKNHIDQMMIKLSRACYALGMSNISCPKYTKDNLLFIFSFQPFIWHHFLRQFCIQL